MHTHVYTAAQHRVYYIPCKISPKRVCFLSIKNINKHRWLYSYTYIYTMYIIYISKEFRKPNLYFPPFFLLILFFCRMLFIYFIIFPSFFFFYLESHKKRSSPWIYNMDRAARYLTSKQTIHLRAIVVHWKLVAPRYRLQHDYYYKT